MLTFFKISANLIQAGIRLNGTGGPLFKTHGYLFQNRNGPFSKQASLCFTRAGARLKVGGRLFQTTHIAEVEFTDQKFIKYGNACFRIIIASLKL